jgi:hypothetical protein
MKQSAKYYLVEITSTAKGSTSRLIRSSVRKDLAVRLLTHATMLRSKVFGYASGITLFNDSDGDLVDTLSNHVSPELFCTDNDGRFWCLLSNRNEALELLHEYREDPRYKDNFSDDEVPEHFRQQLDTLNEFKDRVDKFETFINTKWPIKAEPAKVGAPKAKITKKVSSKKSNKNLRSWA